MAATEKIHVTAVDNELYLLATQEPSGSSEICHLKSGYNKPVDYVVFPATILPRGKYNLTMIGINWGGPANFKVVVTAVGGGDTVYQSPAGSAVGACWTVTVPMQV
jgi:hypothetical protein